MSVEPEYVTEGVSRVTTVQFLDQQAQGVGPGGTGRSIPLGLSDDGPNSSPDEGPDAFESDVSYLELKLEDVQSELSLLKEWGARIEMYVDCLVDTLESNNISHVYDVDGSLVSVDECRQKAKTLPHTRKPHCDEELRTKQYEAEIDSLRQEIEALTTELETAVQRCTEQECWIEGLRTAEYQANRRWEVYHENVMQQWSKCYSDLQGKHKDAMARFQSLSTAFENLKKTAAGRNLAADGGFNRADPFRRYGRPSPVRRGDATRPGSFYHQQRQQLHPTMNASVRGGYHGRSYRDRSDSNPVLPFRAERDAILKQFFANLNMIQRRQQEFVAGRRHHRPPWREPRRRQPGPYGEAR